MPLDQAVLIEPLSCSIHAVDRGDIKPGDVVVVAGCGPLGLGMVAAARLKKPGTADRPRPEGPSPGGGQGLRRRPVLEPDQG